MGVEPKALQRTIMLIALLSAMVGIDQNARKIRNHRMTSAEIDALWTIDDPGAGYNALRDALEKHPEFADELHTQITRSLGLQGRFKEGWEELAHVSSNPSDIVRVRVQLESGRLENSSGDRKVAKPYFLNALQGAVHGHFDYYAVDAAHMLGIVTTGQELLDWNEKALALTAKSSDARTQKWRGTLLNNIGWTYHDMGRYPEALQRFEEAVSFQEKYGEAQRIRIARWAVARCLRSLQRYQEALSIVEVLIPFPEAGYVSEEMAEDLLALGKSEEAKPHFKRAYELLSQDDAFRSHEGKRLERLHSLGS